MTHSFNLSPPTPWAAHKAQAGDMGATFVIRDANGWSLAFLTGTWKDTPATAQLMAAAPTMLAALHRAQSTIENLLEDLCDEPEEDIAAQAALTAIRAAIAAAEVKP